jgi:hypothetical protein
VINATFMLGKGNPRWPISNVPETTKVPDVGPPRPRSLGLPAACVRESAPARVAQAFRKEAASVIAWLASLPQRAGNRLFAMNDAEAGWHGWEITVLAGGLARQYRDPRFDTLDSPREEPDPDPYIEGVPEAWDDHWDGR